MPVSKVLGKAAATRPVVIDPTHAAVTGGATRAQQAVPEANLRQTGRRRRAAPRTPPPSPPPSPTETTAPLKYTRDKLAERLAELDPGTSVAVVTLLGSLCPITVGHVQAFVEARRLLLGEASAARRPARLEPFGAVLGLISLNGDGYVGRKLQGKGESSLNIEQRRQLVDLAVAEHDWLGTERRQGETVEELFSMYPHLELVHFYMNGADDVLRNRKWAWAGPQVRMITMGRPGDTSNVIAQARGAGVDLDEGHFIMGPELPDISSSDVRKALACGDLAGAARLLHPDVLAWCVEHGVWRDAASETDTGTSGGRQRH